MRTIALLLALAVAGCGSSAPPPLAPAPISTPTGAASSPVAIAGQVTEFRSSVARLPREAATEQQLADLVAADSDFAFRLYREIAALDQGNVFISPYSISTALSMIYAGARHNTAAEVAEAIGVWPEADAWHAARNRLEHSLADRPLRQPPGGEAQVFTLEPVNTIFGQADYPFEVEYLDALAANYGAGMQAVDFKIDSSSAREAINDWVAERTRDRIEELLADGDVDEMTRAVLINAIYFKANWMSEFNPVATEPYEFQLTDGSSREVAMMHQGITTGYARGTGWQAVSLPYFGASMWIILPDEGRFEQVEQALDATFVDHMSTGSLDTQVDLRLPRWETEARLDLIPQLKAMGVIDLFVPGVADLTGVTTIALEDELHVSGVIHQSSITVDEEGTEAAAATAVVAQAGSGPPESEVELTVDRPFLYLIQHHGTNEILFLGRVRDP